MRAVVERANGWIAGLGRYEPGRPIEEVAREQGFAAECAVKLASNENALGPSPRAVDAMRRAAERMHIYPDGGAYYLRRKLAERLELEPEHFAFGCGSNELIVLLGHVFLGPGRGIVMGERAFVIYRLVADAFRGETVAVPMPAHVHDLPAMVQAVTPETRIVFVANPNNPTGTMVDGAAIDACLDALPENVLLVVDEAYIELLPPEQQPDTLRHVRDGRNVMLLRTFSKTYGLAGLRLGYGVAAPECVALLERVRQPFNVTSMALAAAEAALDDEAHLRATRVRVREGLDELTAVCRELGLDWIPSVVNFLCIDVGQGRRVFEALQARGVIVRPMDVYGLPRHIRVTVGTPEENARFAQVLREVL